MPLPRSAALRGSIRSFSLKRAGTQARTSLRGVGRRTYASEHGAQKSSDLPWLIGSLVVTVPAAGWLWQQGPTKSDHGHGHDAHAEEKHDEEPAEEPKEEQEEAPKEGDDSGKDGDDKQEESKDEEKDEGKDESSEEGEGKDKEVSPKGTAIPDDKARASESKGAKDAQGDVSGANNPSLDSAEQQRKPEGPAATAKVHGTVDKSKRSEEPPPEKTDK